MEKITDEELHLILKGFSVHQIEAYTYHLPELEEWLKDQGHFKGEMAIMGLVLFLKYKDKCIALNKLSDDLSETLRKAEEFLKSLK